LAYPVDSERTVYKAAEGVDELRDVSGDYIVLKEPITFKISIFRRESAGNSETVLVYLFTEAGTGKLRTSTRICG
jgi:hypothetical protein